MILPGMCSAGFMATGHTGPVSTFNPADLLNVNLTNSNNTETASNASGGGVRGTVGFSTGKVMFEFTIVNLNNLYLGFATASHILSNRIGLDDSLGGAYASTIYLANSTTSQSNTGLAIGDVITIFVDAGANVFYGARNGVLSGSMNPSAGTGGINYGSGLGTLYPCVYNSASTSNSCTLNTGGTPFTSAIPSGYSPLY